MLLLAAIIILMLVGIIWMLMNILRGLGLSKTRSVGGKQPPGVKPVRMGPAQPWKLPTYRPVGVHLVVEYGADELILRVDSGSLTITGPEGRCQALWQGDSYHLPITFRITER